ncbi:MAG TPA: hypothetical protein VLG37_03450 [Candidatus Saccharimonadales bacterium]|nr:hypothetical protein [Candidatus Saccharimonadales bacterium]
MQLIKNTAGDTIVEVLVVLAVVGMALGISYATANRSLAGARQAQEHSEALEYIQSQIEDLRVLAPNATADPNKNIFGQTEPFCISDPSVATPIVPLTDIVLTDYTNYPASCVLGSFYHLAITYNSSDDSFTVSAIWDDVRGTGQDQVSLVYRLHP